MCGSMVDVQSAAAEIRRVDFQTGSRNGKPEVVIKTEKWLLKTAAICVVI